MDEDHLLIHRMKNGEEDAVEEFVRKYYPRILKYCQLHAGDFTYAEDLTQETFARFFRSFRQYRHYGKAANYLYVIAGNCCRDHLRKPREMPLEEILASMRDEVWICRAGHAAAKKLSRRYPVSNIKSEGRQVELRVIAPRAPMDNALQANPTLEDVFLSYFGQKGEVSDGTL